MRFKAAMAACVILWLPVVTAAPGAGIAAATLQAEGSGRLEGMFAGSVVNNQTAGVHTITLHIRDGLLEIDQETIEVWSNGVGLTPRNETTTSMELRNATISGFALKTRGHLLLVPEEKGARLEAALGDATLAPSSSNYPPFKPHASVGRNPTHVDVAGAMRVQDEASTAKLEGNFLVVAWESDFNLTDSTGTRHLSTGETDEPVGGSVPADAASRHVSREAYILVRDGFMEIPLAMQPVFLKGGELELTQGELRLENPVGFLPSTGAEIPSGSKLLRVPAPTTIQAVRGQGVLQITFTQAPAEMEVDGVVYAPSGSSAKWLWAVGLLLLVALPTGATVWQRYLLRQKIRALDHYVTSRHFGEALALAQRMRKRRPSLPQALIAEALSLLHAKRYADAERVLSYKPWPLALDVLRDYLMAHAAAGDGRRQDAVQRLRECLEKAPGMKGQAAMDPMLAPLLKEAKPRNPGASSPGNPA